jgi:dihydropteroate synthase
MSQTKLMGILNITPDSFYDGGKYCDKNKASDHIQFMLDNGVDIIDIGAESTRPFSDSITYEEEINRLLPIFKKLRHGSKVKYSIDTKKPKVALAAIDYGITLINDVSGFSDMEMCEVAKNSGCEICAMHMQNLPKTMQINPDYPDGIINHLVSWFDKKIKELIDFGIKKEKIIIDPGIGFGKTLENNIIILKSIKTLKQFNVPLLIGISRKSFMKNILGQKTSKLLPATLCINTMLLMEKVEILRVHDIKEHTDIIDIFNYFNNISVHEK